MIMRKKADISERRFSKVGENLLQIGLWLIALSLLRLGFEAALRAPYSPATAAQLLAMLEYILAALASLSGLFYLVERILRAQDFDQKTQ